jgi:hypothetical protein
MLGLSILLVTESERTRDLFLDAVDAEDLDLVTATSLNGALPSRLALVLVELDSTDGAVLAGVRTLSVAQPGLPIICMGSEPHLLLQAHHAGADGFLTVPTCADDVRLVIRVLTG